MNQHDSTKCQSFETCEQCRKEVEHATKVVYTQAKAINCHVKQWSQLNEELQDVYLIEIKGWMRQYCKPKPRRKCMIDKCTY